MTVERQDEIIRQQRELLELVQQSLTTGGESGGGNISGTASTSIGTTL